jgi:hypothetical protein
MRLMTSVFRSDFLDGKNRGAMARIAAQIKNIWGKLLEFCIEDPDVEIRNQIKKQNCVDTIPSKSTNKVPVEYDEHL